MGSAPVDRNQTARTGLLGVTSLAFASNFDLAALVVLIPVVRQDMGLQVHEAAALPKTFTLTIALLAPLAAVCGRHFGSGATSVTGGVILCAGALTLAGSPSLGIALGAAGALGVGTALARPQLLAMLRQTTARQRLPSAVGSWQAAVVGASVLGGLAVALLAERPGWRAIPIAVALTAALGVVAAVATGSVRATAPRDRQNRPRHLSEPPGRRHERSQLVAHPVASAGTALVAVAAMLSLARAVPHLVAFAVMAIGILLAVAAWHLARSSARSHARVPGVLPAVLIGAVIAGLLQGCLYLSSFWAINDRGWSLGSWGAMVASTGLVALAATVLTGRHLVARRGTWSCLVTGGTLTCSAAAVAAAAVATGSAALIALALLFLGAGSGLGLTSCSIAVMAAAHRDDAPAAASLLTSSLAVGGVVGLGLLASLAGALTVRAWPGTPLADGIIDDLVLGIGPSGLAVEASTAFTRGTASSLLVGSALALVTLIGCSATRDEEVKLH